MMTGSMITMMRSRPRSGGMLGTDRRYRIFIKSLRFTLDDANGVPRTFAKTGTETIAKVIGSEHRLAVYDFDCPFGTGRNTKPAAVTFFLVYFDDFPFHDLYLLFGTGNCFAKNPVFSLVQHRKMVAE
jgi:hypothetical protein